MTIKDILTTPDPAEAVALALAEYLAEDSVLSQFMARDSAGAIALINSEEQATALSLVASELAAFVAVGLPALTPIAIDDKGITGSVYVDVPVYIGVAEVVGQYYETYLHRLAMLVLLRQSYQTQDMSNAGLAPYLISLTEFDAQQLGSKFDAYASVLMVFRIAHPLRYNPT